MGIYPRMSYFVLQNISMDLVYQHRKENKL